MFLGVSIFWALFDQHSSTWDIQAQMLDRTMWLPFKGTFQIGAEQVSAANPFLILVLIPFNRTYALDPLMDSSAWFKPTPRRITIGMLMTSSSFVIVALIQNAVEAGAAQLRLGRSWATSSSRCPRSWSR